jgi:glutamine amidotransferase
MIKVAVIDYGLSNLDSVVRAVEQCGCDAVVATTPELVCAADKLVLPGVGAFPAAMKNMRDRGLADTLVERVVERGTPLLGVCLGMQLLARRGAEISDADGLGLIDGDVEILQPVNQEERVPHMGWNQLEIHKKSPLLTGVEDARDYYFVHSYHLRCHSVEDVVATTPYCGGFVSVLQHENIFATQFHPEKSQRAGFAVLRNFLEL